MPMPGLCSRILVVDDERQIHSSLRLRLGDDYNVISCTAAKAALEHLRDEKFDLCIVDIHMPVMDGLSFIREARRLDPQLGYVVLTAFDTDENLRRSIPLQVYDFLPKPLPEDEAFEVKVIEWVERTRRMRREHNLAANAQSLAMSLQDATIEREVEFVASESSREALIQAATLLT